MKKSRYSPEQVAFGLRQAEEGTPVGEELDQQTEQYRRHQEYSGRQLQQARERQSRQTPTDSRPAEYRPDPAPEAPVDDAALTDSLAKRIEAAMESGEQVMVTESEQRLWNAALVKAQRNWNRRNRGEPSTVATSETLDIEDRSAARDTPSASQAGGDGTMFRDIHPEADLPKRSSEQKPAPAGDGTMFRDIHPEADLPTTTEKKPGREIAGEGPVMRDAEPAEVLGYGKRPVSRPQAETSPDVFDTLDPTAASGEPEPDTPAAVEASASEKVRRGTEYDPYAVGAGQDPITGGRVEFSGAEMAAYSASREREAERRREVAQGQGDESARYVEVGGETIDLRPPAPDQGQVEIAGEVFDRDGPAVYC